MARRSCGVDRWNTERVDHHDAFLGGKGEDRGRGDVVAEPETDGPVAELFSVQGQPRDFFGANP